MVFDSDDLERELAKLQETKKPKESQKPKKSKKPKESQTSSFDLETEVAGLPSQAPSGPSVKRDVSVALGQWLDSASRFSRISDITEIGRRLKLPDGVSIAENVLMAFYEPRELEGKVKNEGWGSRIRALLLLGQDIGSPVWMKGGLKQWAKLRDAFCEEGLLPPVRKHQMVGSPWLDVPDLDVQAASKELAKRVREWEDEHRMMIVPVEMMRRLATDAIEAFSK